MNVPAEWDNQGHPELRRYRAPILTGRAATGAIRGLLTERAPCAVVGMGDAEIKWWMWDVLKEIDGVDPEWLRGSAKASGLDPDGDAPLARDFDRAIRESPILMVQRNWPPVERLTLHALDAASMFCSKPMVSVIETYRMQRNGDFFPCLEGRRVLCVGGVAGWAERMADAGFQERHGASYEVVGRVRVPPRNVRPKLPHVPGILRAIDALSFDIALVSAGGLAAVLCGHIARGGSHAFDCGAVDRMVMGDTRRGPGFDVEPAEPSRDGDPGWSA